MLKLPTILWGIGLLLTHVVVGGEPRQPDIPLDFC